ncbi:MAG: NAD-dependent succinate-semialdehyde dehydrogenase [Gammaproteobacteria bacterium]|nr:MAG: NAD-dependent succinate-semialdehyde dehydrogenase [Gammaproteobacteria bacterium]
MLELDDRELFRERMFYGGRWHDGRRHLEVRNPADGRVLGRVPDADEAAVRAAVAAAAAAFPAWRDEGGPARGRLLQRWYELLEIHREDLARLITLEQGKPLAEARAEVDYAAGFLSWFAGEAPRAYGEVIPAARAGEHIVVLREPIGVTAAITPWNFPAAMLARKAAAALAAGCTMVARPASATPFTALALAELADRAGLPAGVFNVVTGAAERIARTLLAEEAVRKLSFTGSTAVGRELMALCAEGPKRIALELGGNAPFIVFADADLERAVAGALAAKFRNGGQTCVAANRFLVQKPVYEGFLERMAEAIGRLRVGPGWAPSVDIGPLIDQAAVDKVLDHIEDARAKGARCLVGGGLHDLGPPYVQPTLLAEVSPAMRLWNEETFGPVVGVAPFEDEAEAIALGNATPYGLAAYFYTRDLDRAWRVARALEAGMIGINEGLISNPAVPFGGVKASGMGREGAHQGLEAYLETKYLCFGGARPS